MYGLFLTASKNSTVTVKLQHLLECSLHSSYNPILTPSSSDMDDLSWPLAAHLDAQGGLFKARKSQKGWRSDLGGLRRPRRDPFHVAQWGKRRGLVHWLAMSTGILRVWRRGEGNEKTLSVTTWDENGCISHAVAWNLAKTFFILLPRYSLK